MSKAIDTIQQIPVAKIWNHPDNPRKDVGDISELVESIKQNGILQNLTVVPLIGEITENWDGETYRVIIGHRRLAAAKQAGLETVPCVVAMDMTYKEQVETMLMENMQRTDLTVYEQAQGFQMMLDMGSTVEEISESSGFSTSTVRRRVKLLELDREAFKKSEERGASLQDYMELEKIRNIDKRNTVLKTIGTANFRNALKSAIEEEEVQSYLSGVVKTLSQFAEQVNEPDFAIMERQCGYDRWDRKKEVTIPDDSNTAKYYFTANDRSVVLYRNRADAPADPETEARAAQREKDRAKYEAEKHQFEKMADRHLSLRCEFIRGVSKTRAEKHMADIATILADAGVDRGGGYYDRSFVNTTLFTQLLGVKTGKDGEFDFTAVAEQCAANPIKAILYIAFSALERPAGTYFKEEWSSEKVCYQMAHKENNRLDKCYALLESLGYEMSDEELAMQDGSHELFRKEASD